MKTNSTMHEIEILKLELRQFAKDRDWEQFHSPKNLVMALMGEAGELSDVFQWLSEADSLGQNIIDADKAKAREEIADIFLYLIRLSDKLDINLIDAAREKLKINAQKYPVALAKGNATKYNRRDE